jgi:sortase A
VSLVRSVTRGLGELLITAGLVILLFCAYQLFWTNVTADRAADQVVSQLRRQWIDPGAGPAPTAAGPSSAPAPPAVPLGDALALIHIPRLGDDWVKPVVQGVDLPDLARGLGHYPKTANAGEVGNFAVAGHRATNGEPLRNIDKIKKGDTIVVETATDWFTYVVDKHQIVTPTDVWVIEPVPGKPTAKPTQALITLTSCEPRWASYKRWIVFGHLESSMSKAEGTPAALAAGG